MRRLLCLLVCLLLPGEARGAPITPYSSDTLLRYAALPETQQALVDCLYSAMMAHTERYEFAELVAYEDVSAAVGLLAEDFPELFQLGKRYVITYPQNAPEMASAVSFEYVMDKDEADRLRHALLAEAQSLADEAEGEPWQQELFFHDELCRRITYSSAAENHYTATAALLDGVAACEGYTQAMSLVCRLAGIPCSEVVGLDPRGQSHAWNALLMDGTLCFTDVTADDQAACTVRWAVNISREQLDQSYRLSEDTLLPWPSTDAWEFHRRSGALAETEAEATALLRAQLQRLVRTGEAVSLRFGDWTLYEAFAARLSEEVDAYNAAALPEDRLRSVYAWMASPYQPCMTLYWYTEPDAP
mgnify:CR=1 FL=1